MQKILPLFLAFVFSCSQSHTTDLLLDASPDTQDASSETTTDTGVQMPVCGNRIVEAGESCDDMNADDTDGCTRMCRFSPRCGDGTVVAPEVCDDSNRASGDGCRADCLSDETCGNRVVDTHLGEVCDGTPGCARSCRSLELCGNKMVDSAEQCDNAPGPWDGCGIDCRREQSLVISNLTLTDARMGCDYNFDGNPDNQLVVSLQSVLGLLSAFLGQNQQILLLSFMGFESFAEDRMGFVGFMTGADADMNAMNNFNGNGQFFVQNAALNESRLPASNFISSVSSSMLVGGPEDIVLNAGPLPLQLRNAQLRGTLTTDGSGDVRGLNAGLLCGGVSVETLRVINTDLLAAFGGMFGVRFLPPCATPSTPATLVDLMMGGASLGLAEIVPVSADMDLDGDGLETFELSTGDGLTCQAVVTACIDGDGTRVEGRGCVSDARFKDGFSAGFPITAVRAQIIGVR